jgi:hypothetical protein
MDPIVLLALKVAGGCGVVALFVYVLFRLVLAARKMGRKETGGAVVGILVMLFGPNIAPPPPHEVAAEGREQKRNEDDGEFP